MNGMAERCNRTLLEIMQRTMSHTPLPLSLWGEALKTAIYILNRISNKVANKTSCELWTGRKPNLQHFRILDYSVEARPYRPNEKKLDGRIVSCYFIGYAQGLGSIDLMIL